MSERLSPEREAEIRADTFSSVDAEECRFTVGELLAELDAVREERDRALKTLRIVHNGLSSGNKMDHNDVHWLRERHPELAAKERDDAP